MTGRIVFDRQSSMIRQAAREDRVKSSVGTINPGIDATVDVTMDRTLADSPGRLTDAVADAIALEPPAGDLLLEFPGRPLGHHTVVHRQVVRLPALFEGTPQVAILRLMENGSLICQCNLSPIAAAAPGQHTPIEQFEADIQQALGERFQQPHVA